MAGARLARVNVVRAVVDAESHLVGQIGRIDSFSNAITPLLDTLQKLV